MIRRPPRSTRLTHSFPTRRSSDLAVRDFRLQAFGIDAAIGIIAGAHLRRDGETGGHGQADGGHAVQIGALAAQEILVALAAIIDAAAETIDITGRGRAHAGLRSEEHTSELQSLMRISYAVFCLKNKKYTLKHTTY